MEITSTDCIQGRLSFSIFPQPTAIHHMQFFMLQTYTKHSLDTDFCQESSSQNQEPHVALGVHSPDTTTLLKSSLSLAKCRPL